ncbi:hypothetical protein LEP1GSC082_1722 [Leptospira kirschneri str. H2]|nr:hypothetical protein LEP1GSC082_1722 [Leptospira kirschneri str. H2]
MVSENKENETTKHRIDENILKDLDFIWPSPGNLQQNENFSNLLDNLIQYLRLLSKSKEFC